MSERDEISSALSRARIPSGVINLRLKDMGPDCVKVFKRLDGMDDKGLKEFFNSGRGWIVQGEAVKSLQAFHCIMKACLIYGENAIAIDGVSRHLFTPFDDNRTELWDAQVVGVRRYFDTSYKAYPFSPDVRFEAEAALIEALGRNCTPVVHCVGRFDACDWYSDELTAMLVDRCDKVTVGK